MISRTSVVLKVDPHYDSLSRLTSTEILFLTLSDREDPGFFSVHFSYRPYFLLLEERGNYNIILMEDDVIEN
jgi:hypothetical protein